MASVDTKIKEYRNGGEGFIKWADENVRIEITPIGAAVKQWVSLGDLPEEKHPGTGRSYRDMWDAHKVIAREALRMEHNVFVHRTIILCWPRGEGKTYLVCLLLMWRFFCWPDVEIVLCANSKDQTKFVQFSIIRKIIENSPKLVRVVGTRNIQEKQIRLTDRKQNATSFIKSISTASGIVSNIDAYGFTEIFQMKNPEFFQQVDGSIRNVPNALGIIDSTVSAKTHMLYHLYDTKRQGESGTESVYFSYRHSKTGYYKDYWNPNQTQSQLDAYRIKFYLGGFERYFMNVWSAGVEKVFSPEEIEAINYIGADDGFLNQESILSLIRQRNKLLDNDRKMVNGQGGGGGGGLIPDNHAPHHAVINDRLRAVEKYYRLNERGAPAMAPVEVLEVLGDLFDTDWAILAGVDRADPMKTRTGARTILTVTAKGLPGSRSDPNAAVVMMPDTNDLFNLDPEVIISQVSYIYFLLYVCDIEDHSIERLKAEILKANMEYEIDTLTGERFGLFDIGPWLNENDIGTEILHPTYNLQLMAFSEFYGIVTTGRFKTSPSAIVGSKGEEIIREEMTQFDHDAGDGRAQGWFGSLEKQLKKGVQDDFVYAVAWGIHGGRGMTPEHFRARSSDVYFGTMLQPRNLVGAW